MHLVDRANNVLALLLSEDALKNGDIFFVTHSFGGLVVEQVLQFAQTRAAAEPPVANFLHRVRRIVFLGTPHHGADLATWAGRVRLVSRASTGLARNDPNLRSLNHWFRHYSAENHLEILTLTEGQPTGLFGHIVKPDSADAGLASIPIIVDADHFSIASPSSRNSEVYRHVRDFLANPRITTHPQATLVEAVVKQTESIGELRREHAAGFQRIEERLTERALSSTPVATIPRGIVDAEANRRLTELIASRFFRGVDVVEEASRFANELRSGELEAVSKPVKCVCLAWCARLLLSKPDRKEATETLEAARALGATNEVRIAEALALSYEGKNSEALAKLSTLNTNESRSAAFLVISRERSTEDALLWLEQTQTCIPNLDPDGKLFLLRKQLEGGKWENALETVNQLDQKDFERTPALLFDAASAHLVHAAPDELRFEVLAGVPFEARDFPLADDKDALARRRAAQALYERARDAATQYKATMTANEAADRALWLALRDHEQRTRALAQLEASMRDGEHSLRRLGLALQYKLKLDLHAAEIEIERQSALTGGKSVAAALARFSIALTKQSPREVAEYIEKHRNHLTQNLNPHSIALVEIQVLAQSGQIELAERRLKELQDNPAVVARLERFIAEAKGTDPVEAREQQFKRSDTLPDLANLVQLLEEKRDWQKLAVYGEKYFDRTHELGACALLAHARYELEDYEGVITLLEKQKDLAERSDFLRSLLAWSYYWIGDLKKASEALNTVTTNRDDANDRTLAVNLAIASGDWNSLLAFVEKEWERRAKRSAEELLRAGQLAQHLGSSRSMQLIQEAAEKGAENASILIGSYSTAVTGGWEDRPDVHSWLERAAALSGETGPVRQMSLKEMMDRQPDWQRREAQIWEKLQKGEIPIFMAAHLLNRSLVDFFLLPALTNPKQTDPRRRAPIYAFSGARQRVEVHAEKLAVDPCALLTAGLLDQLEKLIAAHGQIVIPHTTLGWLFEERQKIQFHQPSQIADAQEIKRLLSNNELAKFESTVTVDADLVGEIGEDLAAMLCDAKADFGSDKRQRVVVRSSPVHRVGSLMEEEADLTQYSDHLCGCLDLVDALKRQGQLTEAEEHRARAYLRLQEKPWTRKTEIQERAVLYLDQLAVTHLQHLKLLPKIHAAGFTGIVSLEEIAQGERYVRYENLSALAAEIIERIRKSLADGLASGKVVLARTVSSDDDRLQDDRIKCHPGFAVMETVARADAVVIDDRFINQHKNITGNFGDKPILCSRDLLTGKGFTPAEHRENDTALRRAAFCFTPIDIDGLLYMLETAPTNGEEIAETAELKALRESLLVARMSNSLQIPKESVWLDNVIRTLLQAIRAQWHADSDLSVARARSSWLLDRLDIRGWAQRTNPEPRALISEIRYRGQILSLAILQGAPLPVKEKYWSWLEDALLKRIQDEDKELYAALLEQIRFVLTEAVERDGKDE